MHRRCSRCSAIAATRPRTRRSSRRFTPSAPPARSATVRELEIGALAPDEARALAAAALGDGKHASHAAAIAAESGGSPFFIGELARYMLAGARPAREVSLDEVLAFRIGQLPDDARALLSVVAVAGHPVPQSVAVQSAELHGDPLAALAELRRQHMIRAVGLRETDTLETYHDRIRETVVRSLDGTALRAAHVRLARTYELKGDVDPEILVEHWRGAGAAQPRRRSRRRRRRASRRTRSRSIARRASIASRSSSATARPPIASGMRAQLADALANGGRGAEAAEAFLEAAEGANTADALELRRRAAECWLHTGHFDQGVDAIREVLASVGLSISEDAAPCARFAPARAGSGCACVGSATRAAIRPRSRTRCSRASTSCARSRPASA